MAFYHQNRPLRLTHEDVRRVTDAPTPKLCILVHGLGCNEGLWNYTDPVDPDQLVDYGLLLARESGFTPFYVRYNTGEPSADNGKRLADLLSRLLECYPVKVSELVLIGHSMGGLVLRSACHYDARHQATWASKVTHVFYLGTPHAGADLEKLSHTASTWLRATPNPVARLVGTILNLRSQGVKDLRAGTVVHAHDSDELSDDITEFEQDAAVWLPNARHHLIAGTLTANPQRMASVLFGDGLVIPPSAHAYGRNVDRRASHEHAAHIYPGSHHLRLAHDPDIYQHIKRACSIR
jgi:pimeloyl-ACP methyl ester carboxylesterase